MKYIVVIPARYKSTRLPGKPLLDICGVPMVVRTYQQCIKVVSPELVYVATDDNRIKQVCDNEDIQVLMTSGDCLTGTDRVAEAAKQVEADVYINVQGDEPLFSPSDLNALIKAALKNPNQVIGGYCDIDDEEMYRSRSIPKVVFRPDGRVLYMSRAAIPGNKDSGFIKAWRQVCAYAYPLKALEDFANISKKTELESIEDIELLRFLELNWDVFVIPMSKSSIAVDNPEDVEKVKRALESKKHEC